MKLSLEDKCSKQEKIIVELFENLSKNHPDNQAYFNSYFNKKILEIFKIELSYLGLNYVKPKHKSNDIDIKFVYDSLNDITGSFGINKNGKFLITINTAMGGYSQLNSFDKNTRLSGLSTLLKTIFHEIRHLKQYLVIKENVSNKIVLRNAKEFLLIDDPRDTYHKIYRDNHDNFAIEADADYNAFLKRESFIKDKTDINDKHKILIKKTNRDISDMVINDVIYERDYIVDKYSDYIITEKKNKKFLEKYPVLTKEYNSDFTKKDILTLYKNMNSEIKEAESIDNKEERNVIIRDIQELYYELIYKRISNNNIFEIYTAVANIGRKDFTLLMKDIKNYFLIEKANKIDLLKTKRKSTAKSYKYKYQHIIRNEGKIEVQRNNNREMIDINSYIDDYIGEYSDEYLNSFFHSNGFKSRLPKNGMYILNNDVRVTIKMFIDNIFLPNIDKTKSKLRLFNEYNRIVFENTKPSFEIDYLLACGRVNKDYQKKETTINDLLKSELFDYKINLDNMFKSREMINTLELIAHIDEEEYSKKLDQILLCNLKGKNFEYYYSFSDEQLNYFNTLFVLAASLNTNPILNPNKINYYDKLVKNEKIIMIDKEIQKYITLFKDNEFPILK